MRNIVWLMLGLTACDSDEKLSVINDHPEVSIASHSDGDTIRENAVETFVGSVTDNTDDASELSVVWYANGIEACPESVPSADGTTSCTIPSPDENYLTVQ